jgi:hypothetical protein
VVSIEITTENKLIFDGQVIAAESFPNFGGHDEPLKIILFIFSKLFSAANYHRK